VFSGAVFNRGPKQSTTSLSHHLKMYHRDQFILIQQAKDEDLRHNNNNGKSGMRTTTKRQQNNDESMANEEVSELNFRTVSITTAYHLLINNVLGCRRLSESQKVRI
jgi:hypothetical protein